MLCFHHSVIRYCKTYFDMANSKFDTVQDALENLFIHANYVKVQYIENMMTSK